MFSLRLSSYLQVRCHICGVEGGLGGDHSGREINLVCDKSSEVWGFCFCFYCLGFFFYLTVLKAWFYYFASCVTGTFVLPVISFPHILLSSRGRSYFITVSSVVQLASLKYLLWIASSWGEKCWSLSVSSFFARAAGLVLSDIYLFLWSNPLFL